MDDIIGGVVRVPDRPAQRDPPSRGDADDEGIGRFVAWYKEYYKLAVEQ